LASGGNTLRILHLGSLYAPYSFGGAERVTEILAEHQAAAGHDVAVAHLVPSRQQETLRNGVQIKPMAHRNLLWIEDTGKFPAPLRMINKVCSIFNVLIANDVGAILDRFKPHVLHTHSMVELPPMVWAEARKRGIAVVHTLHDYDLLCVRAALFRNGKTCERQHAGCSVISTWKQRFQNNIDVVVAVSRHVLDIHERYGVFADLSPEQKRVILNPVAMAPAQDRPAKAPIFTFGYLGSIKTEKGLDVLIEACRALPKTGWQLKVAGNAPGGMEPWIAKAQDLPIEFLGFQNAPEFLSSIDVLVVPSIWAEPFGLTVIESFAMGVPVICSDVGVMPDIVGRVTPDWVVPASDANALANRMQKVLADGRDALPGPPAFDAIIESVKPDRILGQYLDAYHQAIAMTASQPAGEGEPTKAALKASL
jgi:glycogen synthase